jgi:hypothetical protein
MSAGIDFDAKRLGGGGRRRSTTSSLFMQIVYIVFGTTQHPMTEQNENRTLGGYKA